ncbi:hypothetical protein M8C21_020821 [Ambrosia artemisiifolia]|uniref:Peptidase S54 rhomboid domain-containing protein n=1 Tax=Ambrosia artemisiifolia TaxID=4212 RepID=A0AAD5CG29_AMBAR|nr:hypothetical protein M8C21_020821 [Ambrosia artemisiifolia]
MSTLNTVTLHFTRGLAHSNGAVKGLILANVVVFLLWKVADKEFMLQNFTLHLDDFNSGHYHTLITSSFSHKDVRHIVANMLSLYICGNRIGKLYGPKFLLKLYLAGAFAGSASSLLHQAFLLLSSKDNQMSELDLSKAASLGASDAVQAIFILDRLLTSMEISLFGFTIPVHALLAGKYVWEDIKRVKV